jgi:hypothetical protein
MSRASEFLLDEEARATGGEAQLLAQAQRQRMIAAIDDEGVEALSESQPVREQQAEAARRRREEERAARRARRRMAATLPLFKRLKAGDRVEAKWSKDGVFYEGVVKATMHSGYPNMRAEILFTGYGNVDEASWRDIHLLSPAASDDGGSDDDDDDGGSVRSSPSIHRDRPIHSRSPSPAAAAAAAAARGTAATRGLGGGDAAAVGSGRREVETAEHEKQEEEEEEEEEDAGLLNPALARRLAGPAAVASSSFSSDPPSGGAAAAAAAPEGGVAVAPAKPLSWKEKALAAQRALKEKREQQQQQQHQHQHQQQEQQQQLLQGSASSVLARASELAKAVEETRVAAFLQDESRPKLAMALKKPPPPRK